LSGCNPQQVTEQLVFGTDSILIDGSSGRVKVFLTTGTVTKAELADTGAAQRMGWTVSKIGADRLQLATKDLRSFDIFKDGTKWLVVPTGTFLSPSKTKAVKLTTEGKIVRAKIGETEPPYTDMWISDEALIGGATTDQLTVKWTSGDLAQVQDASGLVVASLHAQDPTKPRTQAPAKR
jgi:hypothetical protein